MFALEDVGVVFAHHDVTLKALDKNVDMIVGKRGIDSKVVLILAHPRIFKISGMFPLA